MDNGQFRFRLRRLFISHVSDTLIVNCKLSIAKAQLLPGGDERDRTDDPLLAKQVLSQLSYTPIQMTDGRWQRTDILSSVFLLLFSVLAQCRWQTKEDRGQNCLLFSCFCSDAFWSSKNRYGMAEDRYSVFCFLASVFCFAEPQKLNNDRWEFRNWPKR